MSYLYILYHLMVVLVSCNILYLKGFLKWGTPRAGLLISWEIHLYMDENRGYHHSRNLDLMAKQVTAPLLAPCDICSF